ncbi:hypothetical protein CLOM621_08028 [Clostridium sp. M62/1]|nr:hypothetical protein CLOM621_08028 [Clostridium sp. M62/1]
MTGIQPVAAGKAEKAKSAEAQDLLGNGLAVCNRKLPNHFWE